MDCPYRIKALCAAVQPWHLLTVLCAIILLSGLSGYPLLDPDEGRYAEIPREMIAHHDFVTPTLNYVPYFEKPPLLYWLNAAGMELLGQNAFAVRLMTALVAVLGLIVVWWLCVLTFGKEAARWGPGILASSVLFFVVARIPIIDMLISTLLAGSLTAWWHGYRRQGGRRYWLYALSGVLLGLATLAKGPVAMVLFVGVVFVYLAWMRRLSHFVPGGGVPLLVSLVVAAPWFIAMERANPGYLYYFLMVQHVDRFLGTAGRVEHARPFYFYFVLAIPGFAMWSALWPSMARTLWRKWRSWPRERQEIGIFLFTWIMVIMLFFSASTCKLLQYVLPVWWPFAATAAAWLAWRFRRRDPGRAARWPIVAVGVAVCLEVVAAIIAGGHQKALPPDELRWPLAFFCLTGVVAAACLFSSTVLPRTHWRIGLLVMGGILPLAGLIPAYQAIARHHDMSGLIPAQLRDIGDHHTNWILAQYRTYNQAFNFYTRHRVILIDNIGEIGAQGLQQPDRTRWFLYSREYLATLPKVDLKEYHLKGYPPFAATGIQCIKKLSARGPLALVVDCTNAEQLANETGLLLWAKNLDRALLLNAAGWRKLMPRAMVGARAAARPPQTTVSGVTS